MESACEQPRTAPEPATFNEVASRNIIPEISIFLPPDNNANICRSPLNGKELSYEAWKSKNQCSRQSPQTYLSKRNSSLYSEFTSDKIFRVSSQKHVRFNSPNRQNTVLATSDINKNRINKIKSVDNVSSTRSAQKLNTPFNKSFEEIYMANVPNRHLDLSIIKPSIIVNDSNLYISDQLISETISEHRNGGRIDALRNFKLQTVPDTNFRDPEKYKCYNGGLSEGSLHFRDTDNCRSPVQLDYNEHKLDQRQTSDCAKGDAVATELLKIIQQQNEHILLLQKQIQFLMQNQASQNETKIHNKEESLTAWKNTATTQIKDTQLREFQSASTVSKLAIDVTTSFEVSLQSQAANLLQNEFARKDITVRGMRDTGEQNTFASNAKKNCNLLEDIKNQGVKDVEKNQNADMSLTLNEPVQVAEQCPSPDNSVHVDMKDYSSDSEVESTCSNDLGWTVYNNVMGQVNNILKKVEDKDLQNSTNMDSLGGKTLAKVREATMRHLREIDMNLPTINEPISSRRASETTGNYEYSPTEVSFAVKQLLMKYLPNDQLAKLAQTTAPTSSGSINDRDTDNLIKRRPDFSFATMQYMKKYNLLTSDSAPIQPTHSNRNANLTKFLDITALKQQPKLL